MKRLDSLPYQRQVLVIYIMAIFMTVIDGTMVNVALPTMAEDFGVKASDVEWISIGYLLAVASVIPAAGWLGDRFGTKRVFLWSLVGFTLASGLCAMAQTLDQLVAFRVLQGFGGGLIAPIGSAMLYRAFPMSERATAATGVLSMTVMAPAAGPLLGGILVDQASWHWIFLINLPIGAVAWKLGRSVLREELHQAPGKLDVIGLVLSGGSVGLLLYTISLGPTVGWFSTRVVSLGLIGVVALVIVLVVELRIEEPMLALRLLRDRLFRDVNIAAAMVYAGFFGQIFVLPIYLQSLRDYSAFESGLASAPGPVAILIVSNLVGKRAYEVVGPRRLMVVGIALGAVVSCMFVFVTLDTPLWVIGLMTFVRGLPVGFVFISIQTAVYATTSGPDTGRATSLFTTQRQIAFASGVALAATVLAATLPDGDTSAAERLPAHQYAFLALGLVMIPAVFWSLRIRDDDVAETRGLQVSERQVAR